MESDKTTCDVCGKQFVSEKGFKWHKEIVHGDGKIKSFQCDEYDKAYSSFSNLKLHMKTKHQDIFAMKSHYK